MTNIKLLSLLSVILLVSCIPFSLAAPLIHNGDAAYTPLANDFPLPFATPTPIPTPTPEPTTTPTPTPKPEPTVWPTLTADFRSTAAQSNLKIEVTGTLTYNKTGIPDASIYVGYSADNETKWENLVQTRSDGTFEAIWIPNATGNYPMIVHWDGNDTLHSINATANLALTPDTAGNVFSVVSNSSISNFAYDSATQQLSFNTNGTSSTTGYAYVCIPKTLVSDTQTLQVNIDGHPIAFTSESRDDVWVIRCVYAQSEHGFSVQIPFMQVLTPASTPWVLIVIILAVLIALIALVVVVRRRRRTAATVAAILKQNRPIN